MSLKQDPKIEEVEEVEIINGHDKKDEEEEIVVLENLDLVSEIERVQEGEIGTKIEGLN